MLTKEQRFMINSLLKYSYGQNLFKNLNPHHKNYKNECRFSQENAAQLFIHQEQLETLKG